MKVVYGYDIKSIEFDPQFLADLIIVGDRFGSQICIDNALKIVKSRIMVNVNDWLPYVLKIFHKFSPNYDDALKKNLHYKVKMISFSIKASDSFTLDPKICRIINKLKIKYVIYLTFVSGLIIKRLSPGYSSS